MRSEQKNEHSDEAHDNDDLLCVISWNEKGFYQADVFENCNSNTPEWYCTGRNIDDQLGVINKVIQKYGRKIKMVRRYFGECYECGTIYERPAETCECGGQISEYT